MISQSYNFETSPKAGEKWKNWISGEGGTKIWFVFNFCRKVIWNSFCFLQYRFYFILYFWEHHNTEPSNTLICPQHDTKETINLLFNFLFSGMYLNLLVESSANYDKFLGNHNASDMRCKNQHKNEWINVIGRDRYCFRDLHWFLSNGFTRACVSNWFSVGTLEILFQNTLLLIQKMRTKQW